MRMKHIVFVVITTVLLIGCSEFAVSDGKLARPPESHVDFSDDTLSKYDKPLAEVLFRYLAGNPRWEIREERGLKYAVRLEQVDGDYETTLNGFYSTGDRENRRQTRVLLSFDKPYGFGRERGNITRAAPGTKDVPLIVESDQDGIPGHSSYTIINGGVVLLEIYDQAPQLKRAFTQNAFKEVCAELRDVTLHREAINKTGIMPIAARYPKPLPTKSAISVKDGSQPGIYVVTAAINPQVPGYAYVKAYDTTSGKRLSADRMTGRSIRHTGWAKDQKTLFHYGSEVTVYEGDWTHEYEARFELWHHPKDGKDFKLAETKRMINGWER